MNRSEISNIKSRIMVLADTLGVGRKKFAEQIGMTYSSFTGKARSTPLNSNAIANILASYPDVNADWLLTGIGEILKETANSYQPKNAGLNQVKDVHAHYSVNAQIADQSTLKMVMDDRKAHNEIVLSQQRTIEKLVDMLKGVK